TCTKAVRGVNLDVYPGKTCALVGESGSGKSVTALSVLRLIPAQAVHPRGAIFFKGQDILRMDSHTLRQVRGGHIGMIFQEPMTSLNPVHTIGQQVAETVRLHQPLAKSKARSLELLDMVGIPDPAARWNSFPHQLSGGQRQRVMIAMALANNPALLIADEPTTALDVTLQAQILALLHDLQQRLNMAILLISHDLGVVRHMADEVYVLRQGEVVEHGPKERIFTAPQHAYTQELLRSTPSGRPCPVAEHAPELIRADKLQVRFPLARNFFGRTTRYLDAVHQVSLAVRQGESLGVVGESGSGKTTLGLALLRLVRSQGAVSFDGLRLDTLSERDMRAVRPDFQVVFQDPYGSLSPRMTVGQIIAEGLDAHGLAQGHEREARIAEILDAVELDPASMQRYPHEFSGGQRQRIAIARALVLRPRALILDEPTSALDRTVQVQIVRLLRDLQTRFGLTYIFITHDLALVRALCHQVIIMHAGQIVERGATERIFTRPEQDYTRRLLAAALE
ncbi:MAG: ABC transporter ATP-binding protein, partial [Desulfovibrionales bacterium]|nr:ABC transporter ATP-binding protein [Desulfovibrionales bacterium]